MKEKKKEEEWRRSRAMIQEELEGHFNDIH